MGGHRNRVHLITADGVEDWPEASKEEVARGAWSRIAHRRSPRLSRRPGRRDPAES